MNDLVKKNNLTPREYKFLLAYFRTTDLVTAFLEAHPKTKAKPGRSMQNTASKFMQKLKAKIGNNYYEFLDMVGLGLDRLAIEIEKGLSAKYIKFFRNNKKVECDDNSTRQKARELLADVLGVKKKQIEYSGTVQNKTYDLKKLTDEELTQFLTLLKKANET